MPTLWQNSPILAAIRAYIDDIYGGNVRAASRSFGLSYETVYAWYKGTRTPRLDSIGNVLELLRVSGKLKDTDTDLNVDAEALRQVKPKKEPTQKSDKPVDAITRYLRDGRLKAIEEYEFIPRAVAVAGAGESLQVEEGLSSLYAFRREFLRREGINPKDALMMYVSGDSMQPTIMDKDTILIDKRDNQPREGYIYVLTLGDALMVKRLQKIADGWLLKSDNERYSPVSVQGQELEKMVIHGRVRWFSRVI